MAGGVGGGGTDDITRSMVTSKKTASFLVGALPVDRFRACFFLSFGTREDTLLESGSGGVERHGGGALFAACHSQQAIILRQERQLTSLRMNSLTTICVH